MNTDLETTLARIMGQAQKRVSPNTERGGLCRCGSHFDPQQGKEVPNGWVFTSDDRNATVRRCELCRASRRVPSSPPKETTFR